MTPTHVTSFEISQRLKAAGAPQESEFYWQPEHKNVLSSGALETVPKMIVSREYRNGTSPNDDFVSAFLAGELGEMLPSGTYQIYLGSESKQYHICSMEELLADTKGKSYIIADTEADARGLMYEYLLLNKLV